ncbi:major facilitator superfamily domain-containing protein [Multifurca ochricompacta]|uniref:Major facilitator superfamily domain-containing protein n=1 Tax=Multifurca ochricompacta TaxID=376703 RepID=A0AAD4QU80_9AGAM|nr:major facilitator superfamily domain-containing protein [Multifurca ochricompacta]
MFPFLRWPSRSAASDSGFYRGSLSSDGRCEAGFRSPTASSAASSATHLPEAATKNKTLPCFVGEKQAVKNLNDPPCSRPLTTARVLVAHIGAALTLFLATTDATIVSTCLPTIIKDFDGSQSEYTWIGVAYLLTQTACQPLYGRISDLVGRKFVLFSSILVFAVGSLLCGAARDLKWLIAARALSGIGGGGIVSSVWVITSEIVDIRDRAKWSQALSVTWSCSAVAGPLLGGIFTQGPALSWRWAFYINLPICCTGALVLALSLNGIKLAVPEGASWKVFLQRFDFIPIYCSTSCIIVGFSFASAQGWTAISTLTLIIVGSLMLILAGVHEVRTTRDALFPHAIFNNSNIIILLIVSLLHNVAFNSGTFYLALYFQTVNVSTSTLRSGLMILPYSLGSSLASMPVAWLLGAIQRRAHNTVGQKWVISVGLFISTIGFALLCLLGENTRVLMQTFLPLLGGFGIGMLFHAPYQAFTSALSPKELAAGTSAFFLVRFTGATVGLACIILFTCIPFELTCPCSQSIAGAIYQGSISRNVLHGSSHQVPNVVSAIRVRDHQDAARYLAILNSTSHTRRTFGPCAHLA